MTKLVWAIRDVVDVFEAWEDHSTMSPRVRHWTRLVRRDVHAIYRAARDPRVPWYAKALAICVAGYALSPIDLIPDFVPILGYVDDVIIVPLGILIVVKLIPPEIMAEHRALAAAGSAREPHSRHCNRHRLGSMSPACRMALLSLFSRAKTLGLINESQRRGPCEASDHDLNSVRTKHTQTDLDRSASLIRLLLAGIFLFWWMSASTDAAEISIGYLRRTDPKSTLSLIQTPANNDGTAGALLAIDDNNTTGRFLNQQFSLEDVRLAGDADAVAATIALAERGVSLVLIDLPADELLKAADAGSPRKVLFFNVGASDDRLREEDCRANVIHTAPTRSMLADALAQYLVWKQWRRWLLVVGSHPEDKLYGDALRRSAKRFGARIVEEKVFEDTGGARRTDSGVVQIQRQLPVFTQGAPAYDVLMAADESEVFASYLPYRTWDPRPVAGSAGLVPTSWDGSHDQWGAVQLQDRFMRRFSRRMTARDMQAWTAVRMIGDSASRTRSTDPKAMLDFLKGPDFALAAFKGQRLTLRDWNLQLRQPILLSDGRMIVSVSPQEGFLHQVSELDTLGIDRPESQCRLK
jgi:ABC transporter substrate binding protein (PQQ-dependent alcohol dehydrogenase system)